MTKLKAARLTTGLSQSELAKKASVPIRTLQAYEQGSKDINKAAAIVVLRLADSLNTLMVDIMEV